MIAGYYMSNHAGIGLSTANQGCRLAPHFKLSDPFDPELKLYLRLGVLVIATPSRMPVPVLRVKCLRLVYAWPPLLITHATRPVP
jgi:hypothetical protein